MKKVFMICLGCPKNVVDSEHMLGILSEGGIEVAGDVEDADCVIINTCAFIQDAVRESIDVILELAGLKQEGVFQKLVVTGCLVQRYGYKLMREIPEVDVWLGTGDLHRISSALTQEGKGFFISRPLYQQEQVLPRLQSTPFYTAYLKIADGCSHRCSFCLIPKLRGPLRSIGTEILMEEAKRLVQNGVKEINLVAQDITSYGKDMGINMGLERLLEALLKMDGINWIRLLYLHPKGISNGLLKLLETEEKICPYLDIPIQHINDEILFKMRRGYGKKDVLELLDKIRALRRRIFLRSTIMVGFPGETEEIFRELHDFLEEAEFEHLGVFLFSPESGSCAAMMDKKVPIEEAEKRKDLLMTMQSYISERKNKEMVGKIVPVLIEGSHPETELLLSGRTTGMAPDIDGRVIINKGHGIIGEIMPVHITEAYTYDLVGEIV